MQVGFNNTYYGECMKTFYDKSNYVVNFTFNRNGFSQEANHVLVICRFQDQWLLTNHKERGLEFPGGKREGEETSLQAACREVYEETGAKINSIEWIGQYQVMSKPPFIKDVYFANISELERQDTYFETLGPVLIMEDILNVRWNKNFSFIMQDDVIKIAIKYIKEELLNN